ncbi:hypothetical protein WK81_25055 [Burkholderia ubonensis]|uniref:hypothetical protein n=1 Tax=Burkholderia ubonensis TaxID=101571 RepID=UPI000752CF11|nr:hypothetical protein [Burkholderia ubonensis]KVV37718.1 hypothetical protein WK81_25055 [Burkholderia ubonensis]
MDLAVAFASIVVAAIANVSFACAVGAYLAGPMLGDASPPTSSRMRRLAADCVVILIVADTFNLFVRVAVVLGGINRLIYLPRNRFGASAGSFPGAGP